MFFEILLAAFISHYLRKNLQATTADIAWDKILTTLMAVSIGMLIISSSVRGSKHIVGVLLYLILFGLVYVSLYRPEFGKAKSMINAVIPYIIVSFLSFLVKLISESFYEDWDNYFETARLFAIIWMVAMGIIIKRQNKALEKQKIQLEEKERENRITESLKAALEVQVAERTAALTLQKEELQHALNDLRATQEQLIQSEKMA